jgi:hypothetical protein
MIDWRHYCLYQTAALQALAASCDCPAELTPDLRLRARVLRHITRNPSHRDILIRLASVNPQAAGIFIQSKKS